MHQSTTMTIKFGLVLAILAAWYGIDTTIAPTIVQLLWGIFALGQIVAFLISGAVAAFLLMLGWKVTGPTPSVPGT